MKNSETKKNIVEWSVMLAIAVIIYLGGWHTEIIGKVQQGALFSGLFKADPAAEVQSRPDASFELQLKNQDGTIVDMKALKGKVIFLNFWATWCPPCIAEMPGIDALSRDIENEEVAFLMISLDENFEKAKKFKEKKDYAFDVYELASPLPKMYHSQSIPTTFVISAEGKLVFAHKGMADYNTKKFKQFLLDQQ